MKRPWTCKACRQPITRLRSMHFPDRWVVVDISPDEDGTVRRITVGDPPKAYGDVLTGRRLDDACADGELLWQLHRLTCPALKPANPRPAHITLDLPNRTPRRGTP